MQINLDNTPLSKVGEKLYILVYNDNETVWFNEVKFNGISVREHTDRYGHGNEFTVDFCIADFEYLDEKNKVKHIKFHFKYSTYKNFYEKPKWRKSSNFVLFEEVLVTCSVSGYNNVYITSDKNAMKKYIDEKNIFESAINRIEKETANIIKYNNMQISKINKYSEMINAAS